MRCVCGRSLTNLVSNAFKFTEKGEVVVRVTRDMPATADRHGQHPASSSCRSRVRDTGIGIPGSSRRGSSRHSRQADSSTTRKYGGTGLGLVISRRLARLMGGDLTLESTPGIGTTFFFTARFRFDSRGNDAGPRPPAGVAGAAGPDRGRHRDQPRAAGDAAAAWSIPVVVGRHRRSGTCRCSNGGMREEERDPFGLVVLDWMLPGMNGLDAAARIRRTTTNPSLPIVLISAYAGKEEEARSAPTLGVNVFLPKPITASSLFDALVEAQGAHVHAVRRALDAPLEREFAGVRVLLAEDNEANQMVASELLSRLGIELDIAEQRPRAP